MPISWSTSTSLQRLLDYMHTTTLKQNLSTNQNNHLKCFAICLFRHLKKRGGCAEKLIKNDKMLVGFNTVYAQVMQPAQTTYYCMLNNSE